MVAIGEPAPKFATMTQSRQTFSLDKNPGKYTALLFFGSSQENIVRPIIQELFENNPWPFEHIPLVGVSINPADLNELILPENTNCFITFDPQGASCEAYRVYNRQTGNFTIMAVVISPSQRVVDIIPFPPQNRENFRSDLIKALEKYPKPEEPGLVNTPAPILIIPNIFDHNLCDHLIALYQRHGGEDSGFMVTDPRTGKTIGAKDYAHKRRSDYLIEDEQLRAELRNRIARRIIPEIEKAMQFKPTRLERYIVACYDGATGGHFAAHRDNTTLGTAHRRFALSINLNDDYDGGNLCFPEYGNQLYRPPKGGACVFSCSMLHMATKVTRGDRYVFLPFLYDDAGDALRIKNANMVEDEAVRNSIMQRANQQQTSGNTQSAQSAAVHQDEIITDQSEQQSSAETTKTTSENTVRKSGSSKKTRSNRAGSKSK